MITKIRHMPKAGRTYAVRSIKQGFLDQLVAEFYTNEKVFLNIHIGKARLHPEDQYNKKVGRQTAVNNMTPVLFQLAAITILTEGTDFIFVRNDIELHFFQTRGKDFASLLEIAP